MANVATTKNELSRLLRRVKRGETVVITERKRPVAQLQPLQCHGSPDARLSRLIETGLLLPPDSGPLDATAFLAARRPRLAAGHSLSSAILSEREESR